MKRRIKSYVLNMHVVGAFSVLIICVSLISCDYWFGRDNQVDVDMGGAFATNQGERSEMSLVPLAPNRKLLFIKRPDTKKVIEKNFVALDIGSASAKTAMRLLDD